MSAPLRKVLDDYQGYRNLKRVVFDLDEILQRTREGRVQDLLLRQEAEQRRGSEDLLNRAAIATLLQKGQVFELRASEMPEPVDVAAVLRF